MARCSSIFLAGLLTLTGIPAMAQQQPSGDRTPVQWAEAAAQQEVRIIDADGTFPVRYTSLREDRAGTTRRVTIETTQGTVSRTLERNGQPLNAEDTAAEKSRLQAILQDPAAWARREKRNATARGYATELVKLMPQAMLYHFVPGQPQLANSQAEPTVVLDFVPNPNFHPPTMASELLTGLAGRLWIGQRTGVLLRVEGRVVQPVNFGWGGMLARVYPGGTVVFEQRDSGGGRWIYSHLDENITVREFLIHIQAQRSKIQALDIQLLPHPVDVAEAVHMLLTLPGAP